MTESIKEKEPFRITNDKKLAWAVDKAEFNRRLANQYMDMAEQTYDFYLSKANKLLDRVQYFNDMIGQYADEQHRLNPDWHYTDSPFMRIVWTKPKTKITVSSSKDVVDQFKGTKYVTEEVKHKIHWDDLKKKLRTTDDGTVFTEDGEVVNGVKAHKVPATMQIKHKNDKGHWVVGDKR